MNKHPIEMLDPVFHWLDGVIAEQGLAMMNTLVDIRSSFLVHLSKSCFWQ